MGLKTLVVVNPNSANGLAGKNWPKISGEIAKHVPDFDHVLTTRQGHATELARQGLQDGYEMIVAVGGDGTNNEVVNGFFENEAPINPDAVFAHITQGTGGDLRKTLGTPKDFAQAAALLAGSSTRQIDVGRMTLVDHQGKPVVRHFINIASFGIGGEVDARVNRTTKIFGGFFSFFWASFVSMLTYKNKQIGLTIDGKPIGDYRIFNCAVANGQYFGGGMHVAPDACMDDGLFDIVLIGDMSRAVAMVEMNKIYKAKHIDHPKVECFKGKVIEATSDEVVLLDVDGEQPGRLPATFTVLPGALRVKTLDA
jgi:YegS/Rv2252/BmrU family lipid kinase